MEAVLRLMLGNLISYAITFSRLFDNIQKYAIFLGASECYRDKLTIIVGGKDATCSTKCCTGAETDALIVIYH